MITFKSFEVEIDIKLEKLLFYLKFNSLYPYF